MYCLEGATALASVVMPRPDCVEGGCDAEDFLSHQGVPRCARSALGS